MKANAILFSLQTALDQWLQMEEQKIQLIIQQQYEAAASIKPLQQILAQHCQEQWSLLQKLHLPYLLFIDPQLLRPSQHLQVQTAAQARSIIQAFGLPHTIIFSAHLPDAYELATWLLIHCIHQQLPLPQFDIQDCQEDDPILLLLSHFNQRDTLKHHTSE